MKKKQTQQERVSNLLQLIKENPELKIVPMVDNGVCCGDDFSYWMGRWGKAKVEEIYLSNDAVHFSSEYDELVEKYADNLFDELYPERKTLTDDEDREIIKQATKIVDELNWEKVILVYIELP